MVAWSDLSQTGGDMDAYAVRGQIFDPRIAAVNLAGTLANDQYTGTQFNDTMSGAAGNDTLTGGNGADWLYGGAGRDHLSGGNGSDHLFGGIGKDILTGGANADVFVFRTAAEAGNGTQGDRITDFTSAADKIDLSTFMAGGQFIGATAFHATGGMEVRYIAASHILQGDADGNGTIDFSLQLDGVAALSSSDFIF